MDEELEKEHEKRQKILGEYAAYCLAARTLAESKLHLNAARQELVDQMNDVQGELNRKVAGTATQNVARWANGMANDFQRRYG